MPVQSRKKRGGNGFTLISREKLLALYASLMRSRMLEEFVSNQTGKTRGRDSRRDHEAPAVALAIDLKRDDTVTAGPGDLLPGFMKDQNLAATLAALGSPARTPFAARLKTALGAARAHRQNGKTNVAVVFCPASSASSRSWGEALKTAGAERLPILFVCDYTADRHALPRLKFPAITVDRNDVVALYRVASEAMAHARRGNGATLIECMAWQAPEEQASSDPIVNMERYLEQSGISPARTRASVSAAIRRKLRQVQ